jgi:peptide/nickel transport system ATP-binding protein
MKDELLLSVRNLTTHFETDNGTVRAVNDVSFDLKAGERLAIVGESGSGKSAMAMSLIRLIAYPGRIVSGEIFFEDKDLTQLSERELNRIRGGKIGTVFQDPMTSLDPVMRIEDQMVAAIRMHLGLSAASARAHAVSLLEQVGIPDPDSRIGSYPFEMSGGMRQRVMIAMALSCRPKLILADEPTTALDVTIQAQIVELLKQLTETTGIAMLFITHDLGLVARFAQKVAVMYGGRIVEYGTVEQLFARPRHPYTRSLLQTIPSIAGKPGKRLLQIHGFPPDMRKPVAGCSFRERCSSAEARCLADMPELSGNRDGHLAACWVDGEDISRIGLEYDGGLPAAARSEELLNPDFRVIGDQQVLEVKGLRKVFRKPSLLPWKQGKDIHAVNGINLTLKRGETMGLVGESGCGKSTVARLLLGLEAPSEGQIVVDGIGAGGNAVDMKSYRQRIQMVFQDPYSSFNPKMTIENIIAEPLDVQKQGSPDERSRRIRELIQQVGLDVSFLERYPNQLSGGQRQRIGIARALALSPSVVVADEPTSALDVSVRAQVINLLCDLKEQLGLSFIFISHDLSTVRHISDSIAVMYLGQIVEQGPAEEVFAQPLHPYTRSLLAAVPIPDPVAEAGRENVILEGELPSPANPPSGCAFHSRCPIVQPRCLGEKPVLAGIGTQRLVACHEAG